MAKSKMVDVEGEVPGVSLLIGILRISVPRKSSHCPEFLAQG